MSSLLTNMSAMSALQSLSATQKSLATTQSQISSGLKVANASDNAAYWSISTKMNSDVSALSSVTDALNLGSSALTTANTALNAQLTTLKSMKQSLVAAQQNGTDRVAIQSAIKADQDQLKSQATSASFNGVNYLAADTGSAGYSANISIVSSFSRDATGSVSTSFISVSRNDTLLYNTGSTSATPSGVSTVPAAAAPSGTSYTVDSYAKMTGILDTTQIQVTTADLALYNSTTTTTGGATAGAASVITASTGAVTTATTYQDGSLAHLQDSIARINAYNAATGTRTATVPALSTADVNALKLYQAGFTSSSTANTTKDGSGVVTSTTVTGVSVATMDISKLTDSDADKTMLASMVSQVDNAITALTKAGSQIGSAQTRVTAQATFVSALSDALTSGVGSLVDADMNVASTRLQALQTQQQLGIQSLSIANQNSQLILKLFQ